MRILMVGAVAALLLAAHPAAAIDVHPAAPAKPGQQLDVFALPRTAVQGWRPKVFAENIARL